MADLKPQIANEEPLATSKPLMAEWLQTGIAGRSQMTIRKLAFLLFAVLLTLESLAMPQPIAAAAQKRTKTKKPSANTERTAPEITTGSDDADVERITVDELKAKIAKNDPMTIIDDRSEGSFETSETQIKGAIRMTVDEIQARLKEIPRDREVITYCT